LQPKQSNVLLYNMSPDKTLKQILTETLGVKVIVNKIRRIYFVNNVKFHFDTIKDLGTFIEVEAANAGGNFSIKELKAKCNEFGIFFDIKPPDYVGLSYSDLLLGKQ
jgi:adenylate cyclase class 2